MVELFLEENRGSTLNGKKKLNIRSVVGMEVYNRQKVKVHDKNSDKSKTQMPINEFFGEITPGIGKVSQNIEKKIIKCITKKTYRETEEDIDKQLSRETIRQRVLKISERAKELERLKTKPEEVKPLKLKNVETPAGDYKKARGGIINKISKEIKNIRRRYFMADGVHVYTQKEGWRECKVGAFLKQIGEKVYEEGVFCTWERVNVFRNLLDWILQKIFCVSYEMIIVSDGAEWIRNSRNKVACLKNVKTIWILDWFHVKEYILKITRKFGFEEEAKETQEIIELLWIGKRKEAIAQIESFNFSEDSEEAEKQKNALDSFKTYFKNQKEGIINYQEFQENGYLVGSGFIEKKNDTLIKNRMVRQKRARWSVKGGEAVMQILVAVMNGRFDELFT